MSELPNGWGKAYVSELVENSKSDIVDGPFGSNLKATEYIESGVPIARIQNVKRFIFNKTNRKFVSEEKYKQLIRHTYMGGDILLTKLGEPLGLACIVPHTEPNGVIVADLVRIRPNSKITNTKYLEYVLNSQEVIIQIASHVKGSTRARINLSVVRCLSVPLAPLAEQKRIVEKLDQVLAQVDTIKARLDGIPAILKRFRQSVLAAAVSGKLTEEWRTLCLFSNIDSNSFELKYTIPENFPRYEIPNTWVKSSIGNFCDFQQGMQIAKSDRFQEAGENRLPILRIGNYATGFTENVDYVDITYNSLIASEDDLILTRTGETRGLVLTGFKGVFHNNTFRINYNDSLITRSYLYFALQELRTQNYILEVSGRSAQPDLTHKKFGPCPISVPPLEEQTEIVRLVDQYFAFADTIEKQVQKAQQRVDKLTQSILAKAFRGELVPQNPDDEPADQLLKRIAAARAESEALAKAAKKVGKKK